jgi:hypothetical protein
MTGKFISGESHIAMSNLRVISLLMTAHRADLARMKVKEFNELELSALNLLGWSLHVPTEAWVETLTDLRDDPVLSFDVAHTDFSQMVTMVLSETDFMFGDQSEADSEVFDDFPAPLPLRSCASECPIDARKSASFKRTLCARLERVPSAVMRVGPPSSIRVNSLRDRRHARKNSRDLLFRVASEKENGSMHTELHNSFPFICDATRPTIHAPAPSRPPPAPPLGHIPFLPSMADSIAIRAENLANTLVGGGLFERRLSCSSWTNSYEMMTFKEQDYLVPV